MRGAPPVLRLALAYAGGAAIGALPGDPVPALALLLVLAALSGACRRPGLASWALTAVALAGVLAAAAGPAPRCGAEPADGASLVIEGRFLAAPRGRSAPFVPATGRCPAGPLTVILRDGAAAGVPVTVAGVWRRGPRGGTLLARSVRAGEPDRSPRWALVRWRGRLVERLDALYGERAPMVSALVLARKEGLDRELREAFARSGTAHLLAISGFHVGVVAGLALALLRAFGLRARRAALTASAVTWGYVALLGFPDAACRAALILTAVALSRAGGRPPARWGALASSLVLLVAADPGRIASPGFQLSFAGAAGLVAWSGGLERAMIRRTGGRMPRGLASAIAAGVAATVATTPVVAWHFERVSIVGIPATLLASPVVALALPGAILSLLADMAHPAPGRFLAGGVDLALILLDRGTRVLASPPWASVWVPRSWVPPFAIGVLYGLTRARRLRAGRGSRIGAAALVGAAGIVVWPVALGLQGRATVEVVAVDVGQGDAVALRSPRGRWVLIDAGPPVDGGAERQPVVAELRRRGVTRIETLVLTHPDLDHFGGAAAVLRTFEVGAVLDPGRAAAKEGFVEVLEVATELGIPWRAAEAGQRIDVDGLTLDVLHPPRPEAGEGAQDANDASVVLILRYGAFDALLTGDAPTLVERQVLAAVPPGLEVLKVGHHGSRTSTDSLLLAASSPAIALVSAGRGNRYGHPHPDILGRLERAGSEIRRTDLEGTLRVVGRRDGSYRVESARARRR